MSVYVTDFGRFGAAPNCHNCRVISSCARVSEFVELIDFTIISRTERQSSAATSHHIIDPRRTCFRDAAVHEVEFQRFCVTRR